MDTKKLTIEDLQKMKEAIGESQMPLKLRVIPNSVVPDDVIIVSQRMYEAIKLQSKTIEQPNIPGMPLR